MARRFDATLRKILAQNFASLGKKLAELVSF